MKKLGQKFPNLYTVSNVMLSGTHTHSAPGGFLMDFLFDVSTLGFIPDTYQALLKGIILVIVFLIMKIAKLFFLSFIRWITNSLFYSQSIERAHKNLRAGKIYRSVGILQDANINRSPTAYQANPQSERSK